MPSTIITNPSDPVAGDAKHGVVDLSEGAANGSVEFAESFEGAPSINCTVLAPDGSAALIMVAIHTVSAAGFSFNLGAPTPAAGYKLHWQAIY